MPFVRSAYNYDRNEASVDSGLDCSVEPSRTQQQFKEEVDINTIVRRFGLTGKLPDDVAVPQFGDFENVVDFHTAMMAVRQAQEQFDALPGELRFRFQNDPNAMMYFLADANNRDEARKLGLLKDVEVPAGEVAAAARAARVAEMREAFSSAERDPDRRGSDGRYREATAREKAADAAKGTGIT